MALAALTTLLPLFLLPLQAYTIKYAPEGSPFTHLLPTNHRLSSPLAQTGLTVIFSEGAPSDDSAKKNCDQNIPRGDNNTNSITILFHTAFIPALDTCFNLSETFTHPNITYSTAGYGCATSEPCGVNYTLSGASNFSPTANYSNVYFQYPSIGDEGPDSIGNIAFQTYGGENCLQGIPEPDDGVSIYPWVEWSCHSEGNCSTVPYSVKSFVIRPVTDAEEKDGRCVLHEAQGGGGEFAESAAGRLGMGLLPAVMMVGVAIAFAVL